MNRNRLIVIASIVGVICIGIVVKFISTFDWDQVAFSSMNGSVCSSRTGMNASLFECRYESFNGSSQVAAIWAEEEEAIQIDFQVEVNSGYLFISIEDEDNESLWNQLFEENGQGTIDWIAEYEGSYFLQLEGGDTQGKYRFSWNNIGQSIIED